MWADWAAQRRESEKQRSRKYYRNDLVVKARQRGEGRLKETGKDRKSVV